MAATARKKLRRGKIKRLLAAAALTLLAAGAFLAFQRLLPPQPARAFPSGAIVIGVDASFPPFALDDGGHLSGLDIDLARAIASEIGLPARFVTLSYFGLYDALTTGKVDLLISALPIEPGRTDDVRYSQPYFDNGLVLAVNAPSAPDLQALAGKAIAYEYASSADSQLRAWESGGSHFQRRPYELPRYALDALRYEQAGAALIEATAFFLYRKEHPAWAAAYTYAARAPYAIAVRHEPWDTLRLLDETLAALKESGELARIIDNWVGS